MSMGGVVDTSKRGGRRAQQGRRPGMIFHFVASPETYLKPSLISVMELFCRNG